MPQTGSLTPVAALAVPWPPQQPPPCAAPCVSFIASLLSTPDDLGSDTVSGSIRNRLSGQIGGPVRLAAIRPGSTPSALGWVSSMPSSRSEEHTSELQSLMRISYAVFCLKKKNKNKKTQD